MKNLADFLFEFIQQPSLLTKISFLKNEAGFEDMQFLFFSKKTLVKSLGIHSFSYVDKKSLDFDCVDSIIEDQDDEIYLNSNETIAVSITIESKSIGFITAPTILNSKETKVVLKTLKKLIESELIQKKLESQLRDRNKELSYKLLEIESLIDVTNIINDQDSELEILFENLLITILSTLNASKGMILLKDPKTDFFNVSSSFNLSKEELPSKIIRITKGVLKDINETKKSLIIDNPEEYPLLKFSKKNILISPLINQNELVGVILLADKESRAGLERFIQQELRLFDNLSKKVSLAYDNIRLIDSLQSSNKLVDNIMTSITTGIIKINVLGELEYVNHSAKKIFGFEEELILNNHYFMVFQKNPHLVNLIEKAENDTNKVLQEENVKIENELDESHEVNLTLSTVYDENNNPSGLVFSFEDLSGINKIKSTFKKYVSENIVDELLKNETSLELVVYLLNHYFDAMIEVVFNHNGTLDKIIGDELMVLYGVPLKNENDAQGAVNSAIAMFEALKKFNIEMEQQNYPALEIGIGINYGKVVCGNIGSERQMNYTVIGDHVNLAARLCSHAKPGEIVISSSVIEKLSSKEDFIQQKPIFVKGKKNEIPIWILKAET